MEAIIAKLLDAFERGHMSRRQLVKNLAVATAGAHLVGGAAPARAASSGSGASAFKTDGLDHISYQVSDYARSRDFYADLMGWEVREDTGTQATMGIGSVGEIIIRNSRRGARGGRGQGAQAGGGAGAGQGGGQAGGQTAGQGRGNRPPVTGVIDHIAWRIENFQTDAVHDELARRGLEPRRDQGGGDDGYDSYHVRDPDGWDLQISGWKAQG